MSDVTERTLVKLQDTHDSIRAAVEQIAEQDASLADEAKLIVSLLDSAVAQGDDEATSPTGASTGAQGAGSTGATGSSPASTGADEPEEADY